jgi:hypothetical protein
MRENSLGAAGSAFREGGASIGAICRSIAAADRIVRRRLRSLVKRALV